jgi:hypothetical protein
VVTRKGLPDQERLSGLAGPDTTTAGKNRASSFSFLAANLGNSMQQFHF